MSQANAERRFSPSATPSRERFLADDAMPIRFRIRAAQIKDLTPLVSVLLDSFYTQAKATQWLYWILRIGIQEDIKAKIKVPANQYACLVATTIHPDSAHSDRVIGTAEISQRPCETWQFFPPQRAYLSNLAISPEHRRRGAARQLISTCETVARGLNEMGFKTRSLNPFKRLPVIEDLLATQTPESILHKTRHYLSEGKISEQQAKNLLNRTITVIDGTSEKLSKLATEKMLSGEIIDVKKAVKFYEKYFVHKSASIENDYLDLVIQEKSSPDKGLKCTRKI